MEFDDGLSVAVPEYALDPDPGRAVNRGSDFRRAGSVRLFDEVEAAGEDAVEAAGAPVADGVADEWGGAFAVAADDRGARRGGCGLAGGVTETRTRRRS